MKADDISPVLIHITQPRRSLIAGLARRLVRIALHPSGDGFREIRAMRPSPTRQALVSATRMLKQRGEFEAADNMRRLAGELYPAEVYRSWEAGGRGVDKKIQAIRRQGGEVIVTISLAQLPDQTRTEWVLVTRTPLGIVVTLADDYLVQQIGTPLQVAKLAAQRDDMRKRAKRMAPRSSK